MGATMKIMSYSRAFIYIKLYEFVAIMVLAYIYGLLGADRKPLSPLLAAWGLAFGYYVILLYPVFSAIVVSVASAFGLRSPKAIAILSALTIMAHSLLFTFLQGPPTLTNAYFWVCWLIMGAITAGVTKWLWPSGRTWS